MYRFVLYCDKASMISHAGCTWSMWLIVGSPEIGVMLRVAGAVGECLSHSNGALRLSRALFLFLVMLPADRIGDRMPPTTQAGAPEMTFSIKCWWPNAT